MTDAPAMPGRWTNEPASWSVESDALVATSRPQTDFWRLTHDGLVRHSGHLYGRPVQGDFAARARISGDYREQYDQAGLMLQRDETSWIKAGVELVDGVAWLSVVVTRDASDWSLAVALDLAQPVRVRMHRHGDTVSVEHSADGASWRLVRQTSLPPGPGDLVGPMLASPTANAFTARFAQVEVTSSA